MNIFKRPLQRYGEMSEPVTPYQKAAQVWDERIGSARAQAANWRLAAMGAILLAIIPTSGLIWQSAQSRVTPYVVEVDKLGEARTVAPAVASYRPSEAQIAWYLAHFITDVRSLSTDPVVVRQNWLQAYDFVTDHGAAILNDYAKAHDPFADVGARTVSVQITSVVPATDTSYQVKWQEDAFTQGAIAGSTHWTAMLTVVHQSPRTAEALRKNPLGIYVNGLAWSEELSPSAKN